MEKERDTHIEKERKREREGRGGGNEPSRPPPPLYGNSGGRALKRMYGEKEEKKNRENAYTNKFMYVAACCSVCYTVLQQYTEKQKRTNGSRMRGRRRKERKKEKKKGKKKKERKQDVCTTQFYSISVVTIVLVSPKFRGVFL